LFAHGVLADEEDPDRLLGNPHAQPPLPADWEVRPTHPVRAVPYYLAALWDKKMAAESKAARRRSSASSFVSVQQETERLQRRRPERPVVPKQLKERLKRSRSAKGLLQDLEEEIRGFIESYDGSVAEWLRGLALDDDDFVLVPGDGEPLEKSPDDFELLPQPEKLIFQGLEADRTASFM
jgi:R3H-associated N-terminal domain